MKWAKRPGNLEHRDMACSIGTAVHSYCEKILKTASIMAINSANKRNGWKTYEDGLARPSKQSQLGHYKTPFMVKIKSRNNGRVVSTPEIYNHFKKI